MAFPRDFLWGAAAASYQIEGAAFEDGKGLSVWDVMCRQSGRIRGGHSGEVSCDHYHRYKQDVALMKRIGLQAYRLSVSWPRVLPEGTGKVNPKGLAFYDQLIDELLSSGIQPWVTLFHWDYPYELYRRGGWLNPESPNWFAEYTKVVVEKLSDRVRHWMTLNEPQCFIDLGHRRGHHAPGDSLEMKKVLLAAHHTLLAHGKSVQAIRAYTKTDSVIGVVPAPVVCLPSTESDADVRAAREEMFAVTTKDVFNNAWWLDPIFFGSYPEDGLALFREELPPVAEGDMTMISQPLDFLGLNVYFGAMVRAGEDGRPERLEFAPGHPITAMRWQVVPQALYWGSKFLYERYKTPIYVTENGMSNLDWVSLDGEVHDPQRIDFTSRYLLELGRAIEDRADVRGYFHWSIMDNFEWAEGYGQRFGLIYVDYATGNRILKDSAHWYRDVIRTNGENLPAMPSG